MPVRNYSFGAGEEKHFGPGNMLRILDSTAPVTVKFFRDGTEISSETAESVEAGYQGEPPNDDGRKSGFDDATVTSATAQTVKILTTRGNSRYDRTVGDVQAEPKLTQSAAGPVGADALSANGYGFFGAIQRIAVAAEYSAIQIKNPAGSGKVLFVDRVAIAAGAACTVNFFHRNADLTELAVYLQNKNNGAAAGLSQLRRQTTPTASLFASALGCWKSKISSSADGVEVKFEPPIRLEAGEGFVVEADQTNVSLDAAFEAREYA